MLLKYPLSCFPALVLHFVSDVYTCNLWTSCVFLSTGIVIGFVCGTVDDSFLVIAIVEVHSLLCISIIGFVVRFEQMLSEMLAHLERQPFNKERRSAWLTLIEPVFDALGLFILAHFRRIFALFFLWMHADDDKTVTLVRTSESFLSIVFSLLLVL